MYMSICLNLGEASSNMAFFGPTKA
jgi:hypothetical protein